MPQSKKPFRGYWIPPRHSEPSVETVSKEELLKEDQYGAESGTFVPTKIDKYAPTTRQNLGRSIESLLNAAYGFSLSEDSEMDHPEQAKKAHIVYNKWAKGIGGKLQKLYKELNNGWKIYYDELYKK